MERDALRKRLGMLSKQDRREALASIRTPGPSKLPWRMTQAMFTDLMESYYIRGEPSESIAIRLDVSPGLVSGYTTLRYGRRFRMPDSVQERLDRLEAAGLEPGRHGRG